MKTILSHLRDAAGPETKLLIVDHVLVNACIDPHPVEGVEQVGAVATDPPKPLLFNLGKTYLHSGDISVSHHMRALLQPC